ncbi:MAG TPA: HAD-IA family hydrolase [Candidatus Saccharimonadales bacterium]|nr:HAD-IA family hydrolase [Candidatus Saccharimonadales bacterium]
MIKAVIFDCFGVLTTEGWLPFKEQQFGRDKALSEQASELNRQSNAGLISHEQFVGKIAELANLSVSEVNEAIEVNVTNQKLFTYITERLRPDYKIGMLSNAAANWLKNFFTDEQLQLFDAISLSYESGITKPDPLSYEKIAGELGVEPGECVFIDDQERHCTGAKEAGMQAILYESFEQMKAELEKILAANSES